MGFLDSGSRWVDFCLTPLGKRMLAEGGLEVRYYSFGDARATYTEGGREGNRRWLNAPSENLMTEAAATPRDFSFYMRGRDGSLVRSDDLGGSDLTDSDWQALYNNLRKSSLLSPESLADLGGRVITQTSQVRASGWREGRSSTPLTLHHPAHFDDDLSSAVHLRYLPPVVSSSGSSEPLGDWGREFPERTEVEVPDLSLLTDSIYLIREEEFIQSRVSFQFLMSLKSTADGSLKVVPLTTVKAESNTPGVDVYNVGVLHRDVPDGGSSASGAELHFFRVFRIYFDKNYLPALPES